MAFQICEDCLLWVNCYTEKLTLSLFSSTIPFLPLQTLTQPSCHDNPIHVACFFDAAKYSKPCFCDLTAIAVRNLREPFQIKTFSQKTLKCHCRQALNKRTHFLPVSFEALTGELRTWSMLHVVCQFACSVNAAKYLIEVFKMFDHMVLLKARCQD